MRIRQWIFACTVACIAAIGAVAAWAYPPVPGDPFVPAGFIIFVSVFIPALVQLIQGFAGSATSLAVAPGEKPPSVFSRIEAVFTIMKVATVLMTGIVLFITLSATPAWIAP